MSRSTTEGSLLDAYMNSSDATADAVSELSGSSTPLDRSRSHSPNQTRPRLPAKSSSAHNTRDGAAKDGNHGRKKKAHVPLDVIDKLDVSGLYGGGSLARHDGPYAATAAARNKGSRAPMAAFDPSNLAPPTAAFAGPPRPHAGGLGSPSLHHGVSQRSVSASAASPYASSSSNLSPRAAATLAAMQGHDLAHGARLAEGPYAVASESTGHPAIGRRNSDSSLNMGYPAKAGNAKGAQLIEMYGVRYVPRLEPIKYRVQSGQLTEVSSYSSRDSEAWEDFGRRQERERVNGQMSRESVAPSTTSRGDRSVKAQSIWDIEATLAAGKPVAQQAPPVPVMPDDQYILNGSTLPDDRPKRSKSLAARLRPSRKASQSRVDGVNGADSPRALRDANGRYDDQASSGRRDAASDAPLANEMEQLSIDASRVDEQQQRGASGRRVVTPSSPVDRFKDQEGYFNGGGNGGADVQRRPSALKRLFSKRRNDKQ
ncbi:hypothetical protein OIO90_001241 [Microbotryomycetes sp. JL221]|nr:hypothetical protein OIO90_001241 [Microbotryomycetes sp. JL221]